MNVGTVKTWNGDRGFGFVRPDDGTADVFLHITTLERAGLYRVAEGDRFKYEPEPGQNGKLRAAIVARA